MQTQAGMGFTPEGGNLQGMILARSGSTFWTPGLRDMIGYELTLSYVKVSAYRTKHIENDTHTGVKAPLSCYYCACSAAAFLLFRFEMSLILSDRHF